MPRQLLRTTPFSGTRPLIYQGVRAIESFRRLEQVIATRLGANTALLFAEPVEDANRTGISWYTELEGDARPLAALDESAQQAARAEIGRQAAALRGLADELRAASDNNSQMAGSLLDMALRLSDDNAVYVVGTQPVITGWGLAPGNPSVQPVFLERFGPAVHVAPPQVVASARRPFWWGWLWPFFIGLLWTFLLLMLLGGPLGDVRPGCMRSEPAPVFTPEEVQDFDREKDREAELRAQLRRLQDEYAARLAACVPPEEPAVPEEPLLLAPEPAPAPPPTPKPAPKPEPAPAPKPQPKPEPKPAPRQGDPLYIPDNAGQTGDQSFLEGCWTLQTPLYGRDNRPIVEEYCFNGSNGGTLTTREKNAQGLTTDICTSDVDVQIGSDNTMRLSDNGVLCQRSKAHYSPYTLICEPDADGLVRCGATNTAPGRSDNQWDGTFRRSR